MTIAPNCTLQYALELKHLADNRFCSARQSDPSSPTVAAFAARFTVVRDPSAVERTHLKTILNPIRSGLFFYREAFDVLESSAVLKRKKRVSQY